MAKMFGAAGGQMFLTLLTVAIIGAFCEGVILTFFIVHHGGVARFILLVVIAIFLFWLLRRAGDRVDAHETERLNWRKGALGEHEVGAELEHLSDDYTVFNNVNTAGFGNFDHIVIGLTGLLAIETKNWNGLISANDAGELRRNGKDSSTPHIRIFFHRTMMLRDQIAAMTQFNEAYIRSVMVFPKAHVEARFWDYGTCLLHYSQSTS